MKRVLAAEPFDGAYAREGDEKNRSLSTNSYSTDRPTFATATKTRPGVLSNFTRLGSIISLRSADKTYQTRSGERYDSIQSKPLSLREAYIARHDPVRHFGLTDDTVFWRVTKEKRLGRTNQIRGNTESVARISNHLAVKPNPLIACADELLSDTNRTDREVIEAWKSTLPAYEPIEMSATELPEPSLNVMYGEQAAEAAAKYAEDGAVLIKFTLGDLRAAGGGQVFLDVGAAANSQKATAFIVTLPAGKQVPVTVVRKIEAEKDADRHATVSGAHSISLISSKDASDENIERAICSLETMEQALNKNPAFDRERANLSSMQIFKVIERLKQARHEDDQRNIKHFLNEASTMITRYEQRG